MFLSLQRLAFPARIPLLIAALWLGMYTPVHAQTLIRDAEIEKIIERWSSPVFKAAGMNPDQVRIVLIQNTSLNAFVAGGANIFLYTGLIEKTETPEELIGVIAHETGHIAGGHLTRARAEMNNASIEAIAGTLLGIGVAVLTGEGGAAAVGATASRSMAERGFLAHSRVQESSADQAGLRFLENSGVNPSGLSSFLDKLASQELLPASQQSEYVRTHPLTRDRIIALEQKISTSPHKNSTVPAQWQDEHARIKAKLTGFITPQQVVYRYPSTDTSVAARYARVIADYRQSRTAQAIAGINGLIATEPKNPYFHELKGQMLFEFGRPGEAVGPLEKAVQLAPDSGLIRTAYAHALIETSTPKAPHYQKAIDHLKRAEHDEPGSTRIKRLLATAYGRIGQEQKARVYLAEEALLMGRRDEAKRMAESVLPQLPNGSPEWIRARDLINIIDQAQEKD